MAFRIHVTAIRNCPPDDVRAVMSEVIRVACPGPECKPVGDLLDIHEHGGWTWFTTSVWGVTAGDLNRGLCQLARPALQFTSSDGDRWYLTVHGGSQGQVDFLHEFSVNACVPDPAEDTERQARLEEREEPAPVDPRLAFLEEDRPPQSDRAKAPFDLVADALNEMGARVPDEFRESVAELPYSAAVNRYRAWHAEQVSHALTEAGIPYDPLAVRSVLLWENISDNEHVHDLGNLPRLLSVLGLGDQWDDWVHEAEAPPEPEQACEAESMAEPQAELVEAVAAEPVPVHPDHFGPVLEIVVPLGLFDVDGGPYNLPLDDLTLIRFFVEALSIHKTAGVVMTVHLPAEARASMPGPTGDGMGTIELTPEGFRLGLDNHLWFTQRDLTTGLGPELAHLLYHLPDDSSLDVAFALAETPALTQRYRGCVADAQWHITKTYPRLTREALKGGLDIARQALKDPEKHKLRDEAEAQAVVELAARDPNLWDAKVHRKGRTIWCESDIVGHLSKVIFRHRFAAHWNVAAHDREAAQQYENYLGMQRQMRRAGAEATRRRAAPHDEAVLLNGRSGLCWRSDFALLDQLEQETREKVDGTLTGLGFTHVGDLVAKQQRDIVLRAYVSQDRLSYGNLMAKRTMYLGYEFFSRFKDGSILTTTTSGAESSQPLLKIYYKTHPGLDVAPLYEKHRWGIERFRTHMGTEPAPLDATLWGVAREYDRALARRKGLSQGIRIIATPPGEPPDEIRAAWVGCVLPLFGTSDDARVGKKPRGVLTRQEVVQHQGFAVRASDAIQELERHDAAAAQWWRDNAPHVLGPRKLFLFPTEVCELIDEI